METHQLLNERTAVADQIAVPVGEHLFDETVYRTFIKEYGVSWEGLLAGRESLPPQGARFDIGFEGRVEGDKIKGTISGVDFLQARADGRFMLHIHAEITTDDGERLDMFEDGIMVPEPGTPYVHLRLNMRLTTASKKYEWVNQLQLWGRGIIDSPKDEVRVSAYAA